MKKSDWFSLVFSVIGLIIAIQTYVYVKRTEKTLDNAVVKKGELPRIRLSDSWGPRKLIHELTTKYRDQIEVTNGYNYQFNFSWEHEVHGGEAYILLHQVDKDKVIGARYSKDWKQGGCEGFSDWVADKGIDLLKESGIIKDPPMFQEAFKELESGKRIVEKLATALIAKGIDAKEQWENMRKKTDECITKIGNAKDGFEIREQLDIYHTAVNQFVEFAEKKLGVK